MKSRLPHPPEPTEMEIQHAAYHLWEEMGCPHGRDLDIWLAARERLRHRWPVRGKNRRGPTGPAATKPESRSHLARPSLQ